MELPSNQKAKPASSGSKNEPDIDLESLFPKPTDDASPDSSECSDDKLLLDGACSVAVYRPTFESPAGIGEDAGDPIGSSWHQDELQLSPSPTTSTELGTAGVSNGSVHGPVEEIDYFSLVGWSNPECLNGLEGAFLGVKSSDAAEFLKTLTERSESPPDEPGADVFPSGAPT